MSRFYRGGKLGRKSIGRVLDASGIPRGTLQGELDELYIFSGILTEEGIRRVMDNGW